MKSLETKVVWTDGMAFEADQEGFTLTLDANPDFGGRGLGVRPKGLALTALAGCTAMDVISILGRMRIDVERFEVRAQADVAEDHPRVFERVMITYDVVGADVPVAKLVRAVQLSEERYCAVSAMLRPTVRIESRIVLNGQVVTAEKGS